MPLYDYKCERGHTFERSVPASQFDFAQRCACGAMARQVWLSFRGMQTPDSKSVNDDRQTYFAHNVTFSGSSVDGTVKQQPNSHADQCACEKCCRHRRRAVVTEVADAVGRDTSGKEVRL